MAEELSFEGEIVKLLDAEPFVPFAIIVSSGNRYEISDPHRVALGENIVFIIDQVEGLSFLRKNQIVSIEQRRQSAA